MTTRRFIIGCMSGTSLDGLDVACVQIDGTRLAQRATLLAARSADYDTNLRNQLRELTARFQPHADDSLATDLACRLAQFHSRVIADLLSSHPGLADHLSLIAAHGQTIYHKPPRSVQLLDARTLIDSVAGFVGRRVPVVYDLRSADLQAGGQGAPITPLADFLIFADAEEYTGVVNLGGFCNVTLLPRKPRNFDGVIGESMLDEIRGFDVCACNQVLDALARALLRTPYDENGQTALSGQQHEDALIDLEGVLAAQSGSRRSLGTGDDAADWISRWRANVSPADLAATACEAIGHTIASRILRECPSQGVRRVLVAGGGANNQALIRALQGWLPSCIQRTDVVGVPIQMREAACMAVLGALCQDNVPITLPMVTGCRIPAPVAGKWMH